MGRSENFAPETARKRAVDTNSGTVITKDRAHNRNNADDVQSHEARTTGRRAVDRYAPDRDDERTRDRDKDKDRHNRPAPAANNSEDHPHWRRVGVTPTNLNNKKSLQNPHNTFKDRDSSDHSQKDKDSKETHPHREKEKHVRCITSPSFHLLEY